MKKFLWWVKTAGRRRNREEYSGRDGVKEDCRAESREGAAVSLVAKLLLEAASNDVRPRCIQREGSAGATTSY
jgi:hypothetical protein